jgi:hypothetical protein
MDDPTQTTEAPRGASKKGRSPSYPGIDLELAVQRAEELWTQEHHYRTAIPTILGHWGYGAKSGGGFAAIAALKSFGLLEDQGTGDERRAWLSDRAQGIITAESPNQRLGLIQEAALMPKVHHELWNRFGANLPSDQSLLLFLMRERNFTPSGATELVSEWKRTMAFAQLAERGDSVGSDNSNDDESGQEDLLTPPPVIEEVPQPVTPKPNATEQREKRTVQVTYSPTEWALLQGQFPMSEEDWDAMIDVLTAMKRGLVRKPS